MNSSILLASASPRRRELLSQIGLQFSVAVSDASEELDPSASAEENAAAIAARKAECLADKAPADDVILAADTVVCLDGEILGKPAGGREAYAMLKALSGKLHEVCTGFALLRTGDGKRMVGVEKTKVKFRVLSDDEIYAYIRTGEPLDKAGAYGIQGMGAVFVEEISGDYSNVVGLPLARVAAALKEFGISIF